MGMRVGENLVNKHAVVGIDREKLNNQHQTAPNNVMGQ
jgi:hypothetical protein